MKLRMIDLFSGCGGLSIGFESSGDFEVIAANDFDPDNLVAFKANHPNATTWEGSIENLDPVHLMEELGLKTGELDVMVGGPPCQGFSRNRARRHFGGYFVDDPRNYLFKEYLRFVKAFLPRVVVIENVADMLVKENGRFGTEILETLSELGYNEAQAGVLNAADFGVPQRRRRAIIIASREGSIPLPTATHAKPNNNDELFGLPHWRTIRDAIGDLPSIAGGEGSSPCAYRSDPSNDYQELMREGSESLTDHIGWKLSKIQSDRLNYLSPGQGAADLPNHLAPKSAYGSAYRRMSWDIPALTITTWMYHPGSGMYFHPSDHRTITVREGARIQSFPDRVLFTGGKVARCRQVGNAVPPLLATAIASQISDKII